MDKKRTCILIAVLVLCLAGFAVTEGVKQRNERRQEAERQARLESESFEYGDRMRALLQAYDFTDCDIETDDGRNYYVTIPEFETLDAKTAFTFARDLDGLNDGFLAYRSARVKCGGVTYWYDTEKSGDRVTYGYLMTYGRSLVTYKNGEYIWDDWSK